MTLSEIESAVQQLNCFELGVLEKLIQQKLAELDQQAKLPTSPTPRVFDLHRGAWEVADDFDEPLPDEFWLGKDA